jgi:2-oxoacid:acceptor oxidoreductase gamma subunit (pyruvate/2-ketoisovalerate family)
LNCSLFISQQKEEALLREIRIHGRGGQGAVTAAQLLAHAAFLEGKWVQAFPYFGAERRGAPVKAFTRISDEPILMHSQIYDPDYVIILSPELTQVVDVTEGLKKDGLILMNTTKKPEEISLNGQRIATVDATGIALELGLLVAGFPVVNTAIAGAFAKATGEVKLESFLKTIKETWSGSAGEKNAKAAELAYERLIKGW